MSSIIEDNVVNAWRFLPKTRRNDGVLKYRNGGVLKYRNGDIIE